MAHSGSPSQRRPLRKGRSGAARERLTRVIASSDAAQRAHERGNRCVYPGNARSPLVVAAKTNDASSVAMNALERPVVIALDGSPRAAGVLERGLELAKALGAKAHVVRAVSIEGEAHESLAEKTPAQVRDDVLSDAARDLRVLLVHAPTDAEPHAILAAPVSGICEFARKADAQLLVVGSHGYGALERLLGTTAARVVENAPCDVYVVRARA